jgi:hypothetical protein
MVGFLDATSLAAPKLSRPNVSLGVPGRLGLLTLNGRRRSAALGHATDGSAVVDVINCDRGGGAVVTSCRGSPDVHTDRAAQVRGTRRDERAALNDPRGLTGEVADRTASLKDARREGSDVPRFH